MFKCPVCGDRHSVPDNYGHGDYICLNSSNRAKQKVFNDMVPEDILSRNQLMNTRSTRIDEARAATIVDISPSFRRDATPIGRLEGKNW